jgi:hypothetical protein
MLPAPLDGYPLYYYENRWKGGGHRWQLSTEFNDFLNAI